MAILKDINLNNTSYELGAKYLLGTNLPDLTSDDVLTKDSTIEATLISIPTVDQSLDANSTNAISNAAVATLITYGTDDLTAGISELATGRLYVVYE